MAEYGNNPTTTRDSSTNTSGADDIMEMDPELDASIQDTDAKFKKACQQLILLNNHIEAIQARYDRASRSASSCRTARYNYRIKLCVVEGVRNMFYEYAVRLADQIDDMRRQAGMIVVREEGDEDDEDMAEEDDIDDEEHEDGYHSEDNEQLLAPHAAPRRLHLEDDNEQDNDEEPPTQQQLHDQHMNVDPQHNNDDNEDTTEQQAAAPYFAGM